MDKGAFNDGEKLMKIEINEEDHSKVEMEKLKV